MFSDSPDMLTAYAPEAFSELVVYSNIHVLVVFE
jgi:hypothetical protein